MRDYGGDLAGKPEIVVGTKGDLPGFEEGARALERELGRPVLVVSAVAGRGLGRLVEAIVRAVS